MTISALFIQIDFLSSHSSDIKLLHIGQCFPLLRSQVLPLLRINLYFFYSYFTYSIVSEIFYDMDISVVLLFIEWQPASDFVIRHPTKYKT